MSKHIKALIFTASFIVAFVLSILLVNQSEGSDLFELEQVKIQYKDFFDGGSEPLITQNGLNRSLGKELNLIVDMSLLDHFYLDNIVHSMTDETSSGRGQFRTISWAFQLGISLTPQFNLAYIHRSEHLLDHVWPHGQFPVQDGILFEFIIYSKTKRSPLLNF